jgi:hypothetical protein
MRIVFFRHETVPCKNTPFIITIPLIVARIYQSDESDKSDALKTFYFLLASIAAFTFFKTLAVTLL